MAVKKSTKAASTVNVTADVKATTHRKAEVKQRPGFSVYIGPSIVGVIQSGTIYPVSRESAIARLAEIIEMYPLVRTLVVDGDTLADDRIKVKTPGNALYVNYHELASGRK